MKIKNLFSVGSSLIALALGNSALAEGSNLDFRYYGGVAISSSTNSFDFGGGATVKATSLPYSVYAGVRLFQPQVFYGVEVEYQPDFETGVAGFPQDGKALRLKAQVGKEFGAVNFYGVLGYVDQEFDAPAAGLNGTSDAITYGLGVELDASDFVAFRIEVLRESGTVTDQLGPYGWTNTRLSFGTSFKF